MIMGAFLLMLSNSHCMKQSDSGVTVQNQQFEELDQESLGDLMHETFGQ